MASHMDLEWIQNEFIHGFIHAYMDSEWIQKELIHGFKHGFRMDS